MDCVALKKKEYDRMAQQDRQKQTLKDDVIDQLMAIGVYKIKDLQLYQVPLHILVQEYRKHVS